VVGATVEIGDAIADGVSDAMAGGGVDALADALADATGARDPATADDGDPVTEPPPADPPTSDDRPNSRTSVATNPTAPSAT
jgi:hypothetical protein